LFHVAKNPARPFIVRSGVTTVRAVGTEFDVYRKASGTTVTVLEGEVAVVPHADSGEVGDVNAGSAEPAPAAAEAPLATILVSAGEQVTVTGGEVEKRPKADTTAATAWTQQRLIFDATPLEDVAAEFNRYNVKRLVIADAA